MRSGRIYSGTDTQLNETAWVRHGLGRAGEYGNYWSSTAYSVFDVASYHLYFNNNNVVPSYYYAFYDYGRYIGFSLRCLAS